MMTAADVISLIGLGVSVVSLIVGTTVTIIVYRLSRKLDFRTRMHTNDELRAVVREFAREMHDKGLNTDVLILNADRYERDYDGGNRFTRHGWVQLASEYIDLRQDGIALLAKVLPSWIDETGRRVLYETSMPADNVLKVGHVPFDWVEHIHPDGNDYKNAPLLYVHFMGSGRTPYKWYTFHESKPVPFGPRGRPYYPVLSDFGQERPSRLQGVRDFWRSQRASRRMQRVEREARRRWGNG